MRFAPWPLLCGCALWAISAATGWATTPGKEKPRVFVTTDISSIEPGVREPDDAESMVRLLLYANDLDLEGLAATSNLEHGHITRPGLIRKILDAYAKDWPKLKAHDPAYPPPKGLRALVCSGLPVADRATPVEQTIGEGKDSEASQALIRAADRDDPRPLWISVWGGTADLAQALWRVRQSRTSARCAAFVARLRVHASSNQDSTGPWLQREFPDLFYIRRENGARGMYRGGDVWLVSPAWVRQFVKGHGALGAIYPEYDGGDRWTKTLGRVRGLKEGDTPCYLNLVSGNPLRGWGGTLVKTAPRRFTDEPSPADASPSDPDPAMAGVYRHRAEFQADFARRLKWCQ